MDRSRRHKSLKPLAKVTIQTLSERNSKCESSSWLPQKPASKEAVTKPENDSGILEGINELSASVETVDVKGLETTSAERTKIELTDSARKLCSPSTAFDPKERPVCVMTNVSSFTPVDVGNLDEVTGFRPFNAFSEKQLPESCEPCENIKTLWKTTFEVFQKLASDEIKEKCRCDPSNCCCENTLEAVRHPVREVKEEPSRARNELASHFFFEEADDGAYRYFCKTCHRYSCKIKQNYRSNGDWVGKGIVKKGSAETTQALKRHLSSLQHQKSVEAQIVAEAKGEEKSKLDIVRAATENFVVAGKFCALQNLPARFYPELCNFIDIIGTNMHPDDTFIHPLGNKRQHKGGMKSAFIACHAATVEELKRRFQATSPATLLPPRIHLAVFKGTICGDATRQIITATFLNNSGDAEEAMLAASVMTDTSAQGAANSLMKEVSKFVDMKNVALVCTEDSAYYTGTPDGMVTFLRNNEHFNSKFVHLADVCHRVETFLDKNLAQWVTETLEKTRHILDTVSIHKDVHQGLLQHQNTHPHLVYVVAKDAFDMRFSHFSEYVRNAVCSVAANLEILIHFLPSLIKDPDTNSFIKSKARVIFKSVTDPVYVARLLLLRKFYSYVTELEKYAQKSRAPGIFYKGLTDSFRARLQILKEEDEHQEIKSLLDHGTVRYDVTWNRKIMHFMLNLTGINNLLEETPKTSDGNVDVLGEYRQWISGLLSSFDLYLGTPGVVDHISHIFLEPYFRFSDKVECFRAFFVEVGLEFYKCGNACAGVKECSCIELELARFLDHCQYKAGLEEFYRYFEEKNCDYVKELNVVNVLRAVEVVLLMKASRLDTERTMACVGNIVKGRFENVFRLGKTTKSEVDTVNILMVLGQNKKNLRAFDKKLAYEEYMKTQGNYPVVWKNKPLITPSTTVKRERNYKLYQAKKSKHRRQEFLHSFGSDDEDEVQSGELNSSDEEKCSLQFTREFYDDGE